ncbi:hypothetical protein AB1N83_012890 [Pleurotus pulmonarius]
MSTNATASQLSSGSDRSAIDITWSCIAVIFACVWKAVHPNVPPPDSRGSKRESVLRRLCMTLWTILLPELVVFRAAAQWHEARRISEAYIKHHPGDIDIPLNAGARSSRDVAQPKHRRLYSLLSSLVSPSDVPRNSAATVDEHPFVLSRHGRVC